MTRTAPESSIPPELASITAPGTDAQLSKDPLAALGDTPAASKQADAVREQVGTLYVVLKLADDINATKHSSEPGGGWVDAELWEPIATVRAASTDAAIRDAIAGDATATGSFVATPARSWKPVKVTLETVSRVKLKPS